jgi:hypothetical protein
VSEVRSFLISALKRVDTGDAFTNDDLWAACPDPRDLCNLERIAWQRLSHWAEDDDIRAKDAAYEAKQKRDIAEALADLEALDAGYLESEVHRGEHQETRLPGAVLLAGLGLIVLLYWAFM